MVGHVWSAGNSRGTAHPVASLQPNDLGLFDMHGNIWEWCQSRFTDRAGTDSPESDEVTNVESRVLRGGSFGNETVFCRSAFRILRPPDDRLGLTGFRVSRTYP